LLKHQTFPVTDATKMLSDHHLAGRSLSKAPFAQPAPQLRSFRLSRRCRVIAQKPPVAAVTTAEPQAAPSLWGALSKAFQKPTAAELVRKVTAAELEELLQAQATTHVPLIVIFSATWCGPCKVMDARLQSLVKKLGPDELQVVKIDTDDSGELATRLRVYKLPTLMFCGPTDGPVVRVQGLMPEHVLQDMVLNRCQYLGNNLDNTTLW